MKWNARETGYLITLVGLVVILLGALYFESQVLSQSAVRAGDGSQSGVLESIVVVAGGIAIGIGVPVATSNRLRPLTPKTAVFTSTVILLSVVIFPVWELVSGHRDGLYFVFGASLPASTLAVVPGVALRQRSKNGVIIGSSAVIGVALSGVLLGNGSFMTLLILPALAVPWACIGSVFAKRDRE